MRESPEKSKPVRVLHVAPYYPPDRVGGVGEFVAGLHEGLLLRGQDSTVLTAGTGGSQTGVRRIARTRLGWFLGILLWARRAADCDVVHCQGGEALPLLLGLALRPRRRARSLVTFHVSSRGLRAAEKPYTLEARRFGPPLAAQLWRACGAGLRHLLDRLSLSLADSAVAVCRATAGELTRQGQPLPVIYNGVGDWAGAAGSAELEPVELLYVGLPSHRKRVLALPFVLRAVQRERPGARLRLAGFDWDEAPRLRALCDELGVAGAVECVGRRSARELAPVYRAARVLLVPSAYEGLPYVILEAMAAGTPVVATRVSGHPEVIEDGVSGLLAPPDDPQALAARCLELLRDPARAARLTEAARETLARRFGLERCVDEYLHYYRTLAGRGT